MKAFAGELNVAGPWLVGQGHQPTDPPAWAGFVAMVGAVGAAPSSSPWRRRLDRAAAAARGARRRLRARPRVDVAGVRRLLRLRRSGGCGCWPPSSPWPSPGRRGRRRRRGGAAPSPAPARAALAVAVVAASVGAADVESSGPRNSEIVAGLAPAVAERARSRRPLPRALGRHDLPRRHRRRGAARAREARASTSAPTRSSAPRCCRTASSTTSATPTPSSTSSSGPSVDAVGDLPGRRGGRRRRPPHARGAPRASTRSPATLRPGAARRRARRADAGGRPAPHRRRPRPPRAGRATDDRVVDLVELGLPAHAFLVPVQGCDP